MSTPTLFEVVELSILELQAAQDAGEVSARSLVEAYIARIAAYDQSRPRLNSIVTLNPNALYDADMLDCERVSKGARGPLHGIPVLVKDNFDTADMPTTGGTLALAGMRPTRDAYQIRRLREAGAVILGKTTLHELASGVTTVASLTGFTRNPYDLGRVPGGSSGGTAVAVAASFAAAGMGTDTCGSIRIPAANLNLVGLRVTSGLSSRTGIIPLSRTQDVAGPVARSMTDLAIMLDATVGRDMDDVTTLDALLYVPQSYRSFLDPNGLKGARIGVLGALFGTARDEEEVSTVVRKAIDAMKNQGAQLVDVSIPDLVTLMRDASVIDYEFKFDLADYLAKQPDAPVRSLEQIIEKGLYHVQLDSVFRRRNAPVKRCSVAYLTALEKRDVLKKRVLAILCEHRLDAIAYPIMRRKPALLGEAQLAINSQLSSNTGLPALSVPAGFTDDDVPIGLELLGADFSEPVLIRLGYAWEQAVQLHRAPFSTPRLVAGRAPPVVSFTTATETRLGKPFVRAQFEYDPTTGGLHYEVSVGNVQEREVAAVTIQRDFQGQTGPVIAVLLRQGQCSASDMVLLGSKERQALMAGQIFLHLHTQGGLLDAVRAAILLPV
jgi:Asp-tRNA(Asn)/Glu-tRNA(Gln) amidotransferase A subunit family amidase